MFYVGILLILFLIRFVCSRNPAFLNLSYYFVLTFLFLFSAFRYEVGCDWGSYYLQFLAGGQHYTNQTGNVLEQEALWWILLDYVRVSELPFPTVNVVSSAAFFLGVHVLARRQPDKLGFLVLLFPILIINMPMSAIRQGAAIGFLCIALCSFIDRRPIWFVLWVLLGAGFHASALSFLLLLPLTKGEYSQRNLMLSGFLIIPAAILLGSGASYKIAVDRYVETGIDAAGAAFRVGLLALSGLYFFLVLRRPWAETYPRELGIVSLGAIGMLAIIFIVPVSTVIGDRLSYYLIPIQVMFLSRMPYLPLKKLIYTHSALPYVVLTVVFLTWINLSWHFQVCYVPYQTWFLGFPEFSPY